MKKMILMLVTAFVHLGYALEFLYVKVVSLEGNPVSNAVAIVDVPPTTGFWGNNSKSGTGTRYEATTDTNGVAVVRFNCTRPDFYWCVQATGYYQSSSKREQFKFEEIFLSPTSSKIILHEHEMRRSVTLYEIRNPQPMCVHRCVEAIKTPQTNGRFGFDMVKYDWVYPYGKGEKADFYLVRNIGSLPASGKFTVGRLEFEKGCGYYVSKKTGNPNFSSTYGADERKSFLTNIVLNCVRHSGQRDWIQPLPVIGKDEFLVLRTRAKFNEEGFMESANYSKILGKFSVFPNVSAEEIVFNPTPNDTNLEPKR